MTEAQKTYLETLREKGKQVWALAAKIEDRKRVGEERLNRFPLWKRVMFYSKFNKIRSIIEDRAALRRYLVGTAIGLVRKAKLAERGLKRD